MARWSENDPLFRREMDEGQTWELWAALQFIKVGLWVSRPPKTWRRTINDAGDYVDEADLWVGRYAPAKIEIKSRPVEFTSRRDIEEWRMPFFVTTLRSWEEATTKPLAVVILSQKTRAMVFATGKQREEWSVVRKPDGVRGIIDDFLAAERKNLYPFNLLIDHLLLREREARDRLIAGGAVAEDAGPADELTPEFAAAALEHDVPEAVYPEYWLDNKELDPPEVRQGRAHWPQP